jgi:polar amino acid transport system substrate-binding protein
MRTRLALPLAALALAAAPAARGADPAAAAAQKPLRVAVYGDFAPFSSDEKGLDVDVARALAAKLGTTADVVSFKAGEAMDDDLRNVVWKGHYLRKEQLADVMMHVPVDPAFAKKNDEVRIVAPYYRERIVVARNRAALPNLATLDALGAEKIGVQFDTLEDHYLWTAFGGRFRENLVHFPSTFEAATGLRKGEVAAVMGLEACIEGALAGARERFAIGPVATPGLASSGWDVGVAVKADRAELAAAVEQAMAALRADGTLERLFTARGLTYLAVRDAPRAGPAQAGAGGLGAHRE